MKLRLLIVEPSEVIAKGMQAVLQNQSQFKVLEPETTVTNISGRIVMAHADVVLINPTVIDSPEQVRGEHHAAVVALVYQYVQPAVLRRYDAVVDINDHRSIIVETLAGAVPGSQTDSAHHNYELSKRETAVLVELAKGKTNKEIADTLNVSVHTIISHRRNIIQKTGIKSVAGLTVYAMMHNLVDESVLV